MRSLSGHIAPLGFQSLREVPDSHSWSQLDDNSFVDMIYPQASVPVVDLEDPKIVELVGWAFQSGGIFHVTNHVIPMGLIKYTEFEARRLFSLPIEQKLKALRQPDGPTGYRLARITPFFDQLMWHEGFTIKGCPIEDVRKLWPDNYTSFCDVMEEYQKEMKGLCMRLQRLILAALALTTEEDLKLVGLGPSGEFTEGCITALQLNHYPSCPNPNRAMGLAPHTETDMFTILCQGDTSGLQIFQDGVGWATVPPVPGALVINIDDVFHILSNGRFPALIHRAVVSQADDCISMAYFYGPALNAQIKPCSKLVEPGDVPHYREMLWREFIDIKAKHLDKAFSLVSNIQQKHTQEEGCVNEEIA